MEIRTPQELFTAIENQQDNYQVIEEIKCQLEGSDFESIYELCLTANQENRPLIIKTTLFSIMLQKLSPLLPLNREVIFNSFLEMYIQAPIEQNYIYTKLLALVTIYIFHYDMNHANEGQSPLDIVYDKTETMSSHYFINYICGLCEILNNDGLQFYLSNGCWYLKLALLDRYIPEALKMFVESPVPDAHSNLITALCLVQPTPMKVAAEELGFDYISIQVEDKLKNISNAFFEAVLAKWSDLSTAQRLPLSKLISKFPAVDFDAYHKFILSLIGGLQADDPSSFILSGYKRVFISTCPLEDADGEAMAAVLGMIASFINSADIHPLYRSMRCFSSLNYALTYAGDGPQSIAVEAEGSLLELFAASYGGIYEALGDELEIDSFNSLLVDCIINAREALLSVAAEALTADSAASEVKNILNLINKASKEILQIARDEEDDGLKAPLQELTASLWPALAEAAGELSESDPSILSEIFEFFSNANLAGAEIDPLIGWESITLALTAYHTQETAPIADMILDNAISIFYSSTVVSDFPEIAIHPSAGYQLGIQLGTKLAFAAVRAILDPEREDKLGPAYIIAGYMNDPSNLREFHGEFREELSKEGLVEFNADESLLVSISKALLDAGLLAPAILLTAGQPQSATELIQTLVAQSTAIDEEAFAACMTVGRSLRGEGAPFLDALLKALDESVAIEVLQGDDFGFSSFIQDALYRTQLQVGDRTMAFLEAVVGGLCSGDVFLSVEKRNQVLLAYEYSLESRVKAGISLELTQEMIEAYLRMVLRNGDYDRSHFMAVVVSTGNAKMSVGAVQSIFDGIGASDDVIAPIVGRMAEISPGPRVELEINQLMRLMISIYSFLSSFHN